MSFFRSLGPISEKFLRSLKRLVVNKFPKLVKRSRYAHFLHEHKVAQSALMPEKEILKKTASIALVLLVLSSINPTGYIFGESNFATQASSYLTPEDIEYNNLAQLVATEEGFLVKNMPEEGESVKVDRLDYVSHQVQRGETLELIASMYTLSPETIVWENGIVNIDTVKPGDTLSIPPANGISHIVKRGDTLLGLAVKYETDSELIKKYNLLSSGLNVGAKVFIPGGKRITTQLIAEQPKIDTTKPANKPTKIANIQTDINANIAPNYPGFEKPPAPKVAPIKGVTSSKSIVQDADPSVKPATIKSGSARPNQVAPVSSGIWGKPTDGNITQGYKRGHYALDIANRSRPAIWATAGGTVEVAGWGGAYGNYVIVDHGNGYKTLYAHNDELYVTEGDKVSKGQIISKMGNTGRVYGATGIHLHYECHKDGERINPYTCME